MALTPLTALSPLDGRYHNRVAALRDTFSELALIRFRVRIEIEWLKTLAAEPSIREVPPFSPPTLAQLDEVAAKFSEADGEAVKLTEARINHDVKAVEYFLREARGQPGDHEGRGVLPLRVHVGGHQQPRACTDAEACPRPDPAAGA